MSRVKKRKKITEKERKFNEANLYRFKSSLDVILEYLHKDIDLYSAAVEEYDVSVRTETMEWFQWRVCTKIDELEQRRPWRKNKGNVW